MPDARDVMAFGERDGLYYEVRKHGGGVAVKTHVPGVTDPLLTRECVFPGFVKLADAITLAILKHQETCS